MPARRWKILGILRDALRTRSVGIIEELPEKGLVKYAKPAGVIAGLLPVTNPLVTMVNIMGVPLDSIGEVRARMAELAPQLREPDLIRPAPWQSFGRQGRLDPAPFIYPIADFYRTDPISRSSTVMAECSALHVAPIEQATGTYG